jgi:hydrogenase nickel incorporation protein HypB
MQAAAGFLSQLDGIPDLTASPFHFGLIGSSLRERFRHDGIFVVSLVSNPGAGKAAFLEKTLTILHQNHRVAALVGDLATDNDAARLARSHAPVKQITTGTLCHL